jgi:ParB-like chromosome segregation protein Spo0J
MTAPTRCTVRIGDIQVPSGKRAPNKTTIEQIAKSIKALGLLNPILVRAAGPRRRCGQA